MGDLALHRRLHSLTAGPGPHGRTLRLAALTLRLTGLDDELVRILERRWGAFLARDGEGNPGGPELRLLGAGRAGWLAAPAPGEVYRVEAVHDAAHRVIASYHFGLGRERGAPASWRLGITEGAAEPAGRILDNATRIVVAALALERGGLALHAAGLLRRGRAYLLAGPSRSGKTTATALAAPAESLGDDFGLILREGDRWCVPALPFDNSERVTHTPPRGLFPLAGVWRLHQAERTRAERPRAAVGVASLMGCLAFPWVFPEAAPALLERAGRIVAEGRFGHLYFDLGADLWSVLVDRAGEAAIDTDGEAR